MRRKTRSRKTAIIPARKAGYETVLSDVVRLLETARRSSARTVNAIMTATYWEIGRRIVEYEQAGAKRAEYGDALLKQLGADLTTQFGRGFAWRNLYQMRAFFIAYPNILQTPSAKSAAGLLGAKLQTPSAILAERPIPQTLPGESAGKQRSANLQTLSEQSGAAFAPAASVQSSLAALAERFPLPWSTYVRLLSVQNPQARSFYETEALRGGWSVRQLDRQIESQFYERTALSRNKAAMLHKGQKALPTDTVTPEEEIKDPYVLEFLGLKDEYSEGELEDTLIQQLEGFLLELGGDFAFIGRQRRLRIGSEWYRVDLLFFHRRLRCLVVIDLKLGRFTHADAGQMHLYLNYAREHWTHPGENPPVGLILCAQKDAALARYALEGLPNKVLAAEYRTTLPKEKLLAAEITRTRATLERRRTTSARRSRKL